MGAAVGSEGLSGPGAVQSYSTQGLYKIIEETVTTTTGTPGNTGSYLPLVAGSSSPLTGSLYLGGNSIENAGDIVISNGGTISGASDGITIDSQTLTVTSPTTIFSNQLIDQVSQINVSDLVSVGPSGIIMFGSELAGLGSTSSAPVYVGDPVSGLVMLDQSGAELIWLEGLSLNGQPLNMNNGSGTGGGIANGYGGGGLNLDGAPLTYGSGGGFIDNGAGGGNFYGNIAINTGNLDMGNNQIVNVAQIIGVVDGSPTSATATLDFSAFNAVGYTPDQSNDALVLGYGSNASVVFVYSLTPTTDTQFNLDSSSQFFLPTVINAWASGAVFSATWNNATQITITAVQEGVIGNQQNGTSVPGVTITNFTGGSVGPQLVTIDSNVVVNGSLAFVQPYTTLTEANNGETLGTTFDTYFLYVGPDNVQFGVNITDPSTMTGRELTFINTGQQSEFYPYIMGNINNSSGNQYNLSNTTVKMLSDGTTWWITSQV